MQLEIIAHRGFSAISPENTLAAFFAAIQHQANSIEFDVQLSSDKVPVIIHDATVDRTTDGIGKVKDKTLEQLKELDAGAWFSSEFSGEKIPTLKEALRMAKDIEGGKFVQQFIYAEVKESDDWSASDIDNFIQTIISEGWENKCIVACFNEKFLGQVRNHFPSIPLGYLVNSLEAYTQRLSMAANDGNAVMLSQYNILLNNPSLVQSSRSQGVDVVAWTVDSQEDLQRLAELGVVRIVTNSLIDLN
ncbi:MAG TPA: glycerophosphodiester phosphodiesterase family protein [Candidatus Obscuribacterales bacterium]